MKAEEVIAELHEKHPNLSEICHLQIHKDSSGVWLSVKTPNVEILNDVTSRLNINLRLEETSSGVFVWKTRRGSADSFPLTINKTMPFSLMVLGFTE